MSEILIYWYAIFIGLFSAFIAVLWMEKERKLYFLYSIMGMVFGFYFDMVSVMFGYYSYPDLLVNLWGVPLSMTLAEGFSVALTIKIAEIIKSFWKKV